MTIPNFTRFRDMSATIVAVAGVLIAVWALIIATNAQGENRQDLRDTEILALESCQAANRNRPQIAINQMLLIDGILKSFGTPLADRRQAAQAAFESLEAERRVDGSAGPRDCTGDAVITIDDYPKGTEVPVFIDARTGLPTGATP